MYRELSLDERKQLEVKIVKILEEASCTVRQAQAILSQASRDISGTAPVQFVETPYEF